jgi:RND family efflux transporter MFP subunit
MKYSQYLLHPETPMPSDSLDRLSIDKSRQAVAGKGRLRLKLVTIAAVALAAAAGVIFVRSRAVTIETATVIRMFPTQSFTLLNASGYVVAQRKAAVASKTTGRLEWIGVEEGSRVTAGEVIARLENRDLQALLRQGQAGEQNAVAALEQAKAELAEASRSFSRQKELLREGIVSHAEYDAAEARFKRSTAAVSGAEAALRVSTASLQGASINLDYSLIRAPFNAVVLTKNADVGDIITPLGAAANAKAAVVTIADLGSLQVEVDVSESNLAQVKNGQPCEITLEALPDKRFRGVVHTVVPTADRSKASVLVKVRFLESDSRILPEMSARVAFLEHEPGQADLQPRLAVNPSAVVKAGGREGVYLVKDTTVVFTPVTRVGMLGEMVEISGLASGDKVALKPLEKLKNGTRIVPLDKK